MKDLTYTFNSGGDIFSISRGAIAFAQKHVSRDGQPVRVWFTFNDLDITAYSSSNYMDIAEKYNLQAALRRAKLGHRD